MALTATTLSSAVGVNDVSIVVASATGFAAGSFVRVDQELMKVAQSYVSGTTIPVLRGQDGTVTSAHKTSANAVVELGSDLTTAGGNAPQTFTQFPGVRARFLVSYSAAGAISIPQPGADTVAVINGTGALAMTLAVPTKDMDGDLLIVIANGKAAHTLTVAGGIGAGGASFDVGTFTASLQTGCILMACNGVWVMVGNGIAGATAATAGPLWA